MKRLLFALPLALLATPAAAHTGVGETGSLMAGLLHPLMGADHVVAMMAVGIWAAQRGGRAVWLWPAGFVTVMLAGFVIAASGIALPAVEPTIIASVAILGIAAALAPKVPTAASAALIVPFALAHGHAHGAELGGANPGLYVIGFVLATAALHLAGIGLARAADRPILGAGLRTATVCAAAATVTVGVGL